MTFREEKQIKGIQIGQEVKLSLFAGHIILSIENAKEAIKKLLELISEFSKVMGYKVNTQKSLTFLCTNNEKEIKESISFTNAIKKRIKHPGINLAKKTKELYTDNDKTLMKEITDNIKRWRDMPCSQTGRIDILKISVLPNIIYRLNAIPIKLPMAFLTELEQKNSQFVQKDKSP